MMSNSFKYKLIIAVQDALEHKISTIQEAINLAKESRDSDGKSSVGDKYETGRAMMQIEIQNKENQLSQLLGLKKVMGRIEPDNETSSASLGSLVKTDKGHYFISIPMGQMKGFDCMTISLASPLGRAFSGSKVADKVSFNGTNYTILEIL